MNLAGTQKIKLEFLTRYMNCVLESVKILSPLVTTMILCHISML